MIIVKTSDNLDLVIQKAVEILNNGGIIVYPTETTYGMGVDATNQAAVDKLMDYKEKREGIALSIAVSSNEMAEKYVELNPTAKNIYKNFMPGPVTVISKSKNLTANGIASEKNTIGIRIPNYDLTLKIIEKFGKPITATAANANGKKRPYKIDDILDNISDRQKELIDLIIDDGELVHNNPSTVIDTASGEIETLRLGDNRFDLEYKLVSNSPESTIQLGEMLGNQIKNSILEGKKKATVIGIQGNLGAGKTHFASGIAKGLGIKDPVKSPTFILSNEFDFEINQEPIKFFHIDTYRMESEQDILDIGFEKMLQKPNIVLIEWANRVIPILDNFKDKADFIWLKFEAESEDIRIIYHNGNTFSH